MASWSAPTTYISGDTLAVSAWNVVANNETFLYQAPAANVWDSAGTNLTDNAYTQVQLGGVTVMKYGFSVSSNNLIAPITGTYWVAGLVTSTSLGSGLLATAIYQNGSSVAQVSVPVNAVNAASGVSVLVSCTAGDTLGLWAYQSSGGAMASTDGASQTFLCAAFIGSN